MKRTDRIKIPSLKMVDTKRLCAQVNLVNKVISRMKTTTLKEADTLLYGGAFVVAHRLGNIRTGGRKESEKEGRWK